MSNYFEVDLLASSSLSIDLLLCQSASLKLYVAMDYDQLINQNYTHEYDIRDSTSFHQALPESLGDTYLMVVAEEEAFLKIRASTGKSSTAAPLKLGESREIDFELLDNGKIRLEFEAACEECYYMLLQGVSREAVKKKGQCPFDTFIDLDLEDVRSELVRPLPTPGGQLVFDAEVLEDSAFVTVVAARGYQYAPYKEVKLNRGWRAVERTVVMLKVGLCLMTVGCLYAMYCRPKQYVRIKDEEEEMGRIS